MSLVERVKNLYKPSLGFGSSAPGVSLEESLNQNKLTDEQIALVMRESGAELARLHTHTAEGFGWINPAKAILTRKFEGTYKSWYDFLEGIFDKQTQIMNKIRKDEEPGKYHTKLSPENREKLDYLHNQRPTIKRVLAARRKMLEDVKPQLLHGNVYIGSIFIDNGKFSGLNDYSQMLSGDGPDDLAYFSVMPRGDELTPPLIEGWENAAGGMDNEERLHIYRLWQAYRKIYTRYANHRYLDDYPEPLRIAEEELRRFM